MGSSVFLAACGIGFPDHGQQPSPLNWEWRVLANGPLGKSPQHMDFAGHNEAQNSADGRVICLATHVHPTCSLEISETFNNVDSLVLFLETLILWIWSKIGRINQNISTFQKLSSTHCLIWTP